MADKPDRKYDLEDRLIEFASIAIDVAEALPETKAGNHIAGQILRCGTSAAPNYGEAQAAESRKDFVHKMKVCLKELRETRIWMRLITRRNMGSPERVRAALAECEEFIRIFKRSIQTAERNSAEERHRR